MNLIFRHSKLAWKNTHRKVKQSIIIFLCGFVASLNIFIQISQTNGVESNLYKVINEVFSGQFIIHNSKQKVNILDSQFSESGLFELSESGIKSIYKENPDIKNISPRIRFDGLIAYEDQSIGLNFQALDNGHIARINELVKFKEGGISAEPDSIILSSPIAEALGVTVGNTLVILANNKYGYLSDATVKLSGIFETVGVAEFLVAIAYVQYEKGKELVGLEDNEYMELVVNLKNEASPISPEKFTAYFNANFNQLKISEWQESAPLLSSILSIWQNFGLMTQVLFICFSIMILINIIMMMTQHRKRELGAMIAIGFRPRTILQIIYLEYAIIVMSSVLLSYLILSILFSMLGQNGFPIPSKTMQAAYLSSSLKPQLFFTDFIFIGGLFAFAVLVAVFLGAYKQIKVFPAILLKYST